MNEKKAKLLRKEARRVAQQAGDKAIHAVNRTLVDTLEATELVLKAMRRWRNIWFFVSLFWFGVSVVALLCLCL